MKLVALAIASALAGPQDVRADLIWGEVEAGSWTYEAASADGNTIMFSREGSAPAGHRWFRYEYKPNTNPPLRSLRSLVQADCATGQTITIQSEWFSGANLRGQGTVEVQGQGWNYPAPDTFQEIQMSIICRGER